jgi:hypothetical protein
MARARTAATSMRAEGLFPACTGDRMHRQRQGPPAYEFGVKVSVATTIGHAKGGQFVTHVKALPGNPYDGHTLETVIPDMEALVGSTIARILADKGYGGHNAPPDYECRVFLSGQKRGMTPAIKRELRHRSPAPWLVLTLYERTPYRRFQAFFDRMRSAMMPSWISVVPA